MASVAASRVVIGIMQFITACTTRSGGGGGIMYNGVFFFIMI